MNLTQVAALVVAGLQFACSVRSEPRPAQPTRRIADAGVAMEFGHQIACVLSDETSSFQIDFGVRGCFGGSDNRLRLEKRAQEFSANGFVFVDLDSRNRVRAVPVTPVVARRWVSETMAALQVQEVRGLCHSTGKTFAHVVAQCGASIFSHTFETHDCDKVFRREGDDDVYQHAFELSRIAQEALDELPKDVGPLTPDEERSQRRKWSGLYENGMRVRHDPIEEWELDGG